MNPVYVTDIIGDVVSNAKSAVVKRNPNKTLLEVIQENEKATHEDESDSMIETINYQYGHKRELIETLVGMSKEEENRVLKYPLVYLVQDFSETRGKEPGIYADVSLNILFVHHTVNTSKIKARYEKVFKPVLYPIYYEFMEQLSKHPQIHVEDPRRIRHKKTDRSYWGRQAVGGNDGLKLTDFVDAIEVEDLQIKILFKNC